MIHLKYFLVNLSNQVQEKTSYIVQYLKSLKMMRSTLLSVSILSLIFFTNLNAQVIDSIQVTPSPLISVNDTIRIYIYNTFPSSGCQGSASFSKNGFNVSASALHCQGMLAAICHDVDTVILNPPHTVGAYSFVFVLNAGFGGPPCTPGIIPNDYDTAYFTVTSGTNNQPPSFVNAIENDTVCMNDTLGPLSYFISDEDPTSVVATATSSNQALLPNNNIVLTGGSTNRNVYLVPSTNQTGSTTITIFIEDNGNLRDSSSFELEVEPCTIIGLNENGMLRDVAIYPNPVNEGLYVDFGHEVESSIRLIDVSGKDVQIAPVSENDGKYFFNTSGLSSGMYILKLNTEQNAVNYRIMVNH